LPDPIELGKGELPGSGELGNPELDGVQATITLLEPILQQEPLRRLEETRRAISRSSDNRLDPNLRAGSHDKWRVMRAEGRLERMGYSHLPAWPRLGEHGVDPIGNGKAFRYPRFKGGREIGRWG
jgi:hypothetical protein